MEKMFDILPVCNCQDSKLCCIPHTFNRVCSQCLAAGTNVAYLILISWLTPEKLLMISRFQSWYCRVKVTQRQDGAGTYTAHLQLQHLVYTDTGGCRNVARGTAKFYISSLQAPMFVVSMTAKTESLRSPTVKFTFSCLMRSIFSLTRALTSSSQ